jgi:hypothetical protein
VVGNPPYQGLSKTEQFGYVATTYPRGKADLYAAFLERGLQLVRPGGVSAMVTMNGWMFLGQYREIRRAILHQHHVSALVDLMWCAFESMRHATVAMAVIVRGESEGEAPALTPTPRDEREESNAALARKRAAVLAQVGRHDFDPRSFAVIDGEPIVYWWTKEFLKEYAEAPKLGEVSPARATQGLYNNARFTRCWHEVHLPCVGDEPRLARWVPFTNGADGAAWIEPLRLIARWAPGGMDPKVFVSGRVGADLYRFANEQYFFRANGIAFSMIGAQFRARAAVHCGIFGDMGRSVFSDTPATVLCLLNATLSREVMGSLNPSVHFTVGDLNRVPVRPVPLAAEVVGRLKAAFFEGECGREASHDYLGPGSSAWTYAQDWAQRAVDRPAGAPLPPYEPVYEPPAPVAFVSFALGVAMGRFGGNGEGILDVAPASALPSGILFVSAAESDSLDHPACAPLHAAWAEHGSAVEQGASLRDYLARSFFAYHKGLYENRPIYFPLSSSKKSFVAYVSIHRWTDSTLSVLLADHLLPTKKRLEGEVADLAEARTGSDKKRAREAERRYAQLGKWREELDDFIALVKECAERGAPPVDAVSAGRAEGRATCPKREVDAPFAMDLDDGVMVNSAALWPLLEPQWKDPKKWWKELASAPPAGSKVKAKDYDWAHLAKRYWPTRVDAKCQIDPSLGVAHGCFWKYHPAKAYAWELRLQHELEDPKFTIDEPGSDAARAAFLRDHAEQAREIEEKEAKRRARKGGGEEEAQQSLGVDGDESDDEEADA